MRRVQRVTIVAVISALMIFGCSEEGSEPDTEPDGEAGLLECEVRGFPCRLAEVDDEVMEASQDLGEEVLDMFVDGADRDAVFEYLTDVDEMAEVRAGRHTVSFRLQDGRRIWVVRPDSPMAISEPGRPTPRETMLTRESTGGLYGARATSDHQDVVHRPESDRAQKRALLLAPYSEEHGGDPRPWVAMAHLLETPGYQGGITMRSEDEVEIDDFLNWDQYDLVHLATHGDALCIDDDGVATQRLGPGEGEPGGVTENCANFVSTGIRVPRTAVEVEYEWEVIDRPADSELDLSEEVDSSLSFEFVAAGNYTIEYRISESREACNRGYTYSFCVESPEDESFECPEEEVAWETGVGVEINGDTPPVNPDGDRREELEGEYGLDLVLLPRGLESTSPATEACHSQSPCSESWRVSVGPEFFATNYGADNPLENQVLYFDGCKTAYVDPLADGLAEEIWGPTNAYLGWDDNSTRIRPENVDEYEGPEPQDSIDVTTQLYQHLQQGRSISHALELMGDDRTQYYERCTPDGSDEPMTLEATLQASMGRDLRIREILTPHEYASSIPVGEHHSLERLAAPDDDDRIRMSVRVDGIDPDDDRSDYELTIFIAGQRVPDSWNLAGDEVRSAGEGSYFIDVQAELGQPYDEMPDPTNIRLHLDLPDDDGYSEVEFALFPECRFPTGTYDVIPTPTGGNCPAEVIAEYKEQVPPLEIEVDSCGTYPFSRIFSDSDPLECPCLQEFGDQGSVMRTDLGLEDGESTMSAEIYDSQWPPHEKIDECEHDFTLEFQKR